MVHGFDHVRIEPGVARLLPVFFLSPPGERDQHDILAPWFLPDPPADFITVHPGKADVEQHDVGADAGGSVERGQQIGTISGPGGDGYMSMAHVAIACWRLNPGGGHESVPFTGPNAIAGQEFPDTGGGNQYMGVRVMP